MRESIPGNDPGSLGNPSVPIPGATGRGTLRLPPGLRVTPFLQPYNSRCSNNDRQTPNHSEASTAIRGCSLLILQDSEF